MRSAPRLSIPPTSATREVGFFRDHFRQVGLVTMMTTAGRSIVQVMIAMTAGGIQTCG